MKPPHRYKTWIEIEEKAVRHNVAAFRSVIPRRTALFAVVKSNAYGHGLELFSGLADTAGVSGFCVDSVIEGEKLRRSGIRKPILVLGPTLPELAQEAASRNITLTVSNFDALRAVAACPAVPDFHLKIETGMHRQGFNVGDIPRVIKKIRASKTLSAHLTGAYTHFSVAKDVTYPGYTVRQMAEFDRARALFRRAGFTKLVFHAAATGGAALYPKAHYDAVRIGIGLYGYWPTREVELQHPLVLGKRLRLEPVLSWRALVSEVKTLALGDFVGYDLTERINVRTQAAIVPIGYWHGFPRALSKVGYVLVKGKPARVLGRVSMDLIVIGVPRGTTARPGDRVTLLGKDGKTILNAFDVAEVMGASHYELLTRLNPLMKRIRT